MKRYIPVISFFVLLVASLWLGAPKAEAYTNSRMIDGAVWDNVNSMTEAQIQAFLASKNSCLTNYTNVEATWTGTQWTYTGNVPASRIIWKTAQEWGLNPQVILATLQKEQSLITLTSCSDTRKNSAMGYACPDSGGLYDYPAIGIYGTCVNKQQYAGFTRQVLWGSWQLMFGRQRSEGNTAWNGDGSLTYGGYMTQGTFKRCNTCADTYYSGNATIDGQTIFLENGPTASLYSYTPHLGQSFPGIFENWFGSTYAGPQCQNSQANVYRFWSKTFNNVHFYTTDSAERSRLNNDRNWIYEGVGFCALTAQTTGYVPVHRFWSPKFSNAHFFTPDLTEKNRLMSDPNWVYEGIGFYSPVDQATDPSAKPVARFWSPRFSNDHFFTPHASETAALKTDPNWVFEGISWYGRIAQ